MDAYSGYNQIPMDAYYLHVMPFGLRNVGATYQQMMN